MTVDRAHMLATPGMDRHGAYVGMTRHREGMALHYGRDDFKDDARLVRTLSRERTKDMASDYRQVDPVKEYAERQCHTVTDTSESSHVVGYDVTYRTADGRTDTLPMGSQPRRRMPLGT